MPREVFPYVEDQVIISEFLSGDRPAPHGVNGTTFIHLGKLHVSGDVFMWYDTQGALWAKIGNGHIVHGHIRAFNHIAELMGLPCIMMQRSARDTGARDLIYTTLWFDGQEIGFNSPFLVLGNMSMRAWREGVKANA